MENSDAIKYTDYIPVAGYSLDDLAKLLYTEDRDLQNKNADALGKIVENMERGTNLPLQYLDNLEFLPGDTADTQKYRDLIENMQNSQWDYEKSPAALSSLIRDFGNAIGPNGDIGKATRRNEAHQLWMEDKDNQSAFLSLDKNTIDLLKQENINKLLNTGNTSEMFDIASGDKVAELPDLNEILSDDAMRSLIAKSDFDTSAWNGTWTDTIGLPKEIAAMVINGIVKGDEKINRWIDQHNRLYGTNYTLDNCIDENGNLKEDLPEQLKGALKDAYGRATAPARTFKPFSVNRGGGGGGNGNGSGNGNGNEEKHPMMTDTINVHLPTATNMANFSKMMNADGSTAYFLNFKKKMDTYDSGSIEKATDFSYKTNWDDVLNFHPSQSGDSNSTIYNLDKLNAAIDNAGLTIRYESGDDRTYVFDRSNRLVATFAGNVGLDYFKRWMKSVYHTLNDTFEWQERVQNKLTFMKFDSPVSSSFNSRDFSVVMSNENGEFCIDYDDFSEAGLKSLDKIVGFSYGNILGTISFVAEVTDKEGNKQQVILKAKDSGKYRGMAEFCYNHIQNNKEHDAAIGWLLNNLEYADLMSELECQWVDKDGDLYFKQLEITNSLCRKYGLHYMPVSFYGCSIRQTQQRDANNVYSTKYYMVDKEGNMVGNYMFTSPQELLYGLALFFDAYENVPSLADNANMKEYYLRMCTGLDADVSDADGKQYFFPGTDTNFFYKRDKVDMELRAIIEIFSSDVPLNNGKIAETRNGNLVNVNRTAGDGICAGDIVKLKGSNEYFIILPYGNDYILVDKDMKYRGAASDAVLKSTDNKIFKGKYRGTQIL